MSEIMELLRRNKENSLEVIELLRKFKDDPKSTPSEGISAKIDALRDETEDINLNIALLAGSTPVGEFKADNYEALIHIHGLTCGKGDVKPAGVRDSFYMNMELFKLQLQALPTDAVRSQKIIEFFGGELPINKTTTKENPDEL